MSRRFPDCYCIGCNFVPAKFAEEWRINLAATKQPVGRLHRAFANAATLGWRSAFSAAMQIKKNKTQFPKGIAHKR